MDDYRESVSSTQTHAYPYVLCLAMQQGAALDMP